MVWPGGLFTEQLDVKLHPDQQTLFKCVYFIKIYNNNVHNQSRSLLVSYVFWNPSKMSIINLTINTQLVNACKAFKKAWHQFHAFFTPITMGERVDKRFAAQSTV